MMISRIEPFTHFILGRWFPLIELGCVALATILWEVGEVNPYLPLLIALTPWVVRLVVRSSPFAGWGIDIALVLFLITAVVAARLAYDQPAAIYKFWLLVAAVFLFYSFANQPQGNLWILASLIGLIGIGLALYYLVANDWGMYPSRIALLNSVGHRWMIIRPSLQGKMIPPNTIAAIIGITLPILLVLVLRSWREKKWLGVIATSLGMILVVVVWLMTASRHAWVALGALAIIGAIWWASGYLARSLGWKRWLVFAVIMILGVGIAGGITAGRPGLFQKSISLLLASGQTTNRLEMTQGALNLIGDFPFTGAGLESFPGLFSIYYLITPNYIIPHSYNLFLDIALEQGILAFLALLWILGVSTVLLLNFGKNLPWPLSALRWAVLASLLVFVVHSFFDDILYDYNASPLLFVLPGMAMALTAPGLVVAPQSRRQWLDRRVYLGTTLIVLALLVVGFFTRQSFMARWYANLGALQMARVELGVWNTSAWKDGDQVEQLKPAEELFLRSLEYDPGNRTANHRLGLMDMMRRNFPAAIAYLTNAYKKDPNHRGIAKALGQSYLWNGDNDQALLLLEKLPETRSEMDAYSWWWRMQGREDLARNAEMLIARLTPATTQ